MNLQLIGYLAGSCFANLTTDHTIPILFAHLELLQWEITWDQLHYSVRRVLAFSSSCGTGSGCCPHWYTVGLINHGERYLNPTESWHSKPSPYRCLTPLLFLNLTRRQLFAISLGVLIINFHCIWNLNIPKHLWTSLWDLSVS